MNFSAYGLESSRTPSYASSSFGAVKVSSGPVTAQDDATMEYVTKTKTKVIKVEGDKKEEQVAQEVTAEVEEQASEEKQEQKLVEAEAVAEEWRINEDNHL